MNILLTSVGRRAYLVDYFKQALQGQGQVIAANMFAAAPGMYAADIAVVTPPANSPEYLPSILELCQRYQVNLLCALHDLDVYVLSQHQHLLDAAGVTTTLPSQDWGRICLDKYECGTVLERAGIAVPRSVLTLEAALQAVQHERMHYPLVVKARLGFGSLALAHCSSETALRVAYQAAQQHILDRGLQAYCAVGDDQLVLIEQALGGRELCLAVVNDLQGQYCAHFVCEVQSMRAGESDTAVSLARQPYEALARQLSALTGHKGIWGFDCIEEQGEVRVIDINPRFSGDYPFHHLCGANIPAALIAWQAGEQPDPLCFGSNPGQACYKELVPRRVELGKQA